MKTALSYIDDLITLKGWESDYRAARELGITQLGHYRAGRSIPDDDVCWKVAERLGISPEVVIAAANWERAERTQNKESVGRWRVRWERAVAALLGPFLLMFSSVGDSPLYILLNRGAFSGGGRAA